MHAVKIITKPKVNLAELLKTVEDVCGKQINQSADNTGLPLTDDQRLAMMLAEFASVNHEPMMPMVASHLSFTTLIMLAVETLPDLLQPSGSLSWFGSGTSKPDVMLGLMTGNLNQWRDAVVSGLQIPRSRSIYTDIQGEFRAAGYADLWRNLPRMEGR